MYFQIYSIPREVINTFGNGMNFMFLYHLYKMESKSFSILFGMICEYL